MRKKNEFIQPAFRRRLKSRRRGAAIVELAILLPFLLMVVLGVVEVGTALKSKSALSGVCRTACDLARKQVSNNDLVVSETKRLLNELGLPAESAVVSIFVNDAPSETATASRNDRIKVSISVPVSAISSFGLSLFKIGRGDHCESMVMSKQ